jgi:hypothetical protein
MRTQQRISKNNCLEILEVTSLYSNEWSAVGYRREVFFESKVLPTEQTHPVLGSLLIWRKYSDGGNEM